QNNAVEWPLLHLLQMRAREGDVGTVPAILDELLSRRRWLVAEVGRGAGRTQKCDDDKDPACRLHFSEKSLTLFQIPPGPLRLRTRTASSFSPSCNVLVTSKSKRCSQPPSPMSWTPIFSPL